MSTPFVLAVSGSASASSKTARCTDLVLDLIAQTGIAVEHIKLGSLDPAALLRGDYKDPGVIAFAETFSRAHGIVLATPIYKASFSGLLKAGLDILPQFGLAGKVVLPLGTGGSIAHVLALDYALRPVLQSMGARHIVQSHFLSEADIDATGETIRLSPAAQAPLGEAVRNFLDSLTTRIEAQQLGHPRPEPVTRD